MDTLTMNIKREFFERIVAKTKRIEYRERSCFWRRRIEPLSTPFKLRLLNGMTHPIPEAVVIVTRVTAVHSAYPMSQATHARPRRRCTRRSRSRVSALPRSISLSRCSLIGAPCCWPLLPP